MHGSSAVLHSSDSVPIIVALHGLAERPLVASTAWPSVSNHMSSGAILRMPPIGKNPERDDGNLCFGCGARHGYSADWLEEDNFINWAHPSGRGNWCRCCHLLHKASFKEFPEKKDLRKWQLDNPSHEAEFKAAHAAYVSVRRGGGARGNPMSTRGQCSNEQLRPGAVASAWEQSRSAIAAQQNQGVEIPRTPLRDR